MKSIENKFAEAMDAIRKAKQTKQFEEKTKHFTKETTIEVKLNAAEDLLKDVGVVREATPIRKHNGVLDNFSESNPLRSVEENSFSPGYITETTASALSAKSDKIMADGLLRLGKITEAEHAKLIGAKPEGYDKLTEAQRKEFDFAKLIGISEADCFKLAKMADKGFREVSRR